VFACAARQIVYQRRLRSQLHEPDSSISDAARVALDDAFEQLRNETTR
jgi:hypothetical protein